jgi:hypothetical protein
MDLGKLVNNLPHRIRRYIHDLAYKCECVGHPGALTYCLKCVNMYKEYEKYKNTADSDRPNFYWSKCCNTTGIKCSIFKSIKKLIFSTYIARSEPCYNTYITSNNISSYTAAPDVQIAVGYSSLYTGNNNVSTDTMPSAYIANNTDQKILDEVCFTHIGYSPNLGSAGDVARDAGSGQYCVYINHSGYKGDKNLIRIGNRIEHTDVHLPNRTHIDILHLREKIYPICDANSIVIIPSHVSKLIIPVKGDFPLSNITFRFPDYKPYLGSCVLDIMFIDKTDKYFGQLVKHITLVGPVMKTTSTNYESNSSSWYCSCTLKKWLRSN